MTIMSGVAYQVNGPGHRSRQLTDLSIRNTQRCSYRFFSVALVALPVSPSRQASGLTCWLARPTCRGCPW